MKGWLAAHLCYWQDLLKYFKASDPATFGWFIQSDPTTGWTTAKERFTITN